MTKNKNYSSYNEIQMIRDGGVIMGFFKKRTIIMEFLGFMFGRCAMFGINPIGMGYFLCLYGQSVNNLFLAGSILFGMMTVLQGVETLKYTLIMGTMSIVLHLIRHTGKQLTTLTKSIIGGLVTCALSLSKGLFSVDYNTYVLLALLEGILVGVFVVLLEKGALYLLYHKKRACVNNQELISIGIMLAIFVYSIPEWSFQGVSFVWIFVYFSVLFSGYKYGAGVGAIIGAACGISLSFQSAETTLIGILCLLGICSGMFQEIGKVGASIAFMVTSISISFLYYETLIEMESLKNLLLSVLFFACIPVKFLQPFRWYGEEEHGTSYMKQNIQMITRNKFKNFSDALTKLSKSFSQFSGPKQAFGYEEVNHIFEDVSGKFCKNCVRCEECWNRNYKDTYESTQVIFSAAREHGFIMEEDVPLEFLTRCINIRAFLREANKSLEIARVNLNWYNRLKESKEAVAEQLNSMAQVMKEFALDVCEIKELHNELEDQMIEKLKSHHIDVKRLIMLENRQKQKEIHLIAKMKRGRCVTSREVAVMLGQVLGIRFRPGDYTKNVVPRESEVMVFVEDAKYKVLTGVARKNKEGEMVCGDNFSFLELGTGQMVMMLSDGMGSGKEASEESEEVIELLEQMMETGIHEKTAIHLINSLYALWSDSQSFSTIDMGIIDLYTGNSSFIKQGAAASFIKRKEEIERIEGFSLPAGMFQQLEVEAKNSFVEDGDFIIMMTDGVLDSLMIEEKEECIEFILSEIKSNNPQEIAHTILEKVLEVSKQTRGDDMTVLVAGIWEKH